MKDKFEDGDVSIGEILPVRTSIHEQLLLWIVRATFRKPWRFVYLLKALGWEDGQCSRALEIAYGIPYAKGKALVAGLVARPMCNNESKLKEIERLIVQNQENWPTNWK